MKVYEAIKNVAAQMAKDGISKSRENKEQKFKFRGIDETLNALAPVLATHGLVVLPRMLSRQITERQTRSGNPLFSVVVEAEFDFVAAEDGSKHTVKTYGEAMDTGDKATNKAMSIAYKYAAFLAFCIPVEGMGEDADTHTHDVAPSRPAGYDLWIAAMDKAAAEGHEAMRAAYKQGTAQYAHYLKTHDEDTLTALTDKANAAKPAASAA
jgi:hypothetical protein